MVFVRLFVFVNKSLFSSSDWVFALFHSPHPWQNEPTMKRTQRRKGLHHPPPASTLSSPLYERILQFRALSCLRQQGTDVRTFAQRFSDAAEGLGFNHAALKDMFNSVLDEPLSWWRMRGLDHLPFGEFVGFLARSPATEAGAPPVAVEEAIQELAVDQEAVPEPVPVQEPIPLEANEAAAPPVVADEAAASRSQKRRRRRRKKASSTLQGLEAVPELSADQEAVPEPLQLLALPAPPKRLALPAPPRLPVLPGPPWQPAKLLAHPWPPDGLEPAWSVPPAPPWPSSRDLVRPEPPWFVPPVSPWLSSRVPVWPDPPWFVPPWPSSRVPVRPDPPWSVPPAPSWLPARIPGLPEPPWLNPPVPPWTCWASLLALAWLPSFPPSPLCLCVWLFLSGLLLCVSLCVVRFLCCHVSVLFLVSLIRDARWRPFWGWVVSGFCHFGLFGVIHGFVTEPWYSHVRVFMWARGFECARVARSLVCVPCFMLERGVWIPAFCHCVSARSRVRSAPRTLVHVCFVVLHAVRVSIGCVHLCYILCCVARSLYIHWLCAFMLSCLVWTRGLWVFSLAACSCPVLHMAGDLFAGHVLVFLFRVSTWLLS